MLNLCWVIPNTCSRRLPPQDPQMAAMREMPLMQQKQMGVLTATVGLVAGKEGASKITVKPEVFFGYPNEDIDEWLARFDMLSPNNAWNSERKLSIMPLYLGGTAMLWYRNIGIKCRTFEDCRSKMLTAFTASKPPLYADDKLHKRVQGETEPLESYAFAVQGLCSKVDPGMPDEKRRDYFVRGLRNDLKRTLLTLKPPTFDKALELTKMHETAIRATTLEEKQVQGLQQLEDYNPSMHHYTPTNPLLPPTTGSESKKGKEPNVHKGVHVVAKVENNQEALMQDLLSQIALMAKDMQDMKAKIGHLMTNPQQGASVTTNYGSRNIPTCTNCHRQGHLASNCYSRDRIQRGAWVPRAPGQGSSTQPNGRAPLN